MAPLLARLASARAVRQQEAEAKAVLRVWRGTSADTQQARADEGRERICVRCYLVITPTILRGERTHLLAPHEDATPSPRPSPSPVALAL